MGIDLEAVIKAAGYIGLFAIIFAETGLLIGFFLPGDTLLITAGLLIQTGDVHLSLWILIPLLTAAAILGDATGYQIGKHTGPRIFQREDSRFFHRKHLERAERFYEKHGPKTIVIARFMPIVRTFAPFVAGVGSMPYRVFLLWNVAGAFLWVGSFIYAGYIFGDLPVVRENFTLLILGIIAVSVMPVVIEAFRAWRAPRADT